MYISYHGDKEQYASCAVSKRNGRKTSVSYTYLGLVIDREKGIYKSKERGVFHFDVNTGEYSKVTDDYVLPTRARSNGKQRVSYDFGDAFFLHAFLEKSGLFAVMDTLGYTNTDTLHAAVLFYILSSFANCDAVSWIDGSIARFLYPKADLSGQRISEMLSAIGGRENEIAFQREYISYVKKNVSPDMNILIDSSGLPNKVRIPLTAINVHNGKVSNEIRLIFVVQKSTGLPLYFMTVPGNIVDSSTLTRVMLHLKEMNVSVESCIIDAGYGTGSNIDFFYDDSHKLKMGYITRVKSSDANLKSMIKKELSTLDSRENFVRYCDRYLFIKRQKVNVGSRRNQPAWLYLGMDLERLNDEQRKLFKKASKEKLTDDEVFDALEGEGLFAVLSGEEYSIDDILPAYYQRQGAEQVFDFAKNYTKLLPLRIHSENTFRGHVLLSYIATCVVKMIHMKMGKEGYVLGSSLAVLRNLKCTAYTSRLITDVPTKAINDIYSLFGIKCPEAIDFTSEGGLNYSFEVKKAKTQEPVMDGGKEVAPKRKVGRPKGSLNRKTLERMKMEAENPPVKRKPGRPKGSRNRKDKEPDK